MAEASHFSFITIGSERHYLWTARTHLLWHLMTPSTKALFLHHKKKKEKKLQNINRLKDYVISVHIEKRNYYVFSMDSQTEENTFILANTT